MAIQMQTSLDVADNSGARRVEMIQTVGGSTKATRASLGDKIKVTINRDHASRFGISAQTIDDTLNDAFGQRQITQYFTQLKTYWIILEILPEQQKTLATLDRLYVKSPLTGGACQINVYGAINGASVFRPNAMTGDRMGSGCKILWSPS